MWQFLQQNALLYGVVVAGVLGVISQVVLRVIYDKMIRDMKNPGMPKGKYMKQLKQKYHIYRRTQSGMDSIQAFIQKSLMEYRFLGMNLHTWRRLGGIAFVVCAAFGIGNWYLTGMQQMAVTLQQSMFWVTLGAMLLIAAAYGITDTGYRRNYLEMGLRSMFTDSNTQAVQEVNLSEEAERPKANISQPVQKTNINPRKRKGRILESQAQRDKRELKENLSKLKDGIRESAAGTERSREHSTEILRQMDPAEQERIIREVLKEFLS